MSRDSRLYLEDIIETMEKMQGFVAGMTRAELEADDKTAFAVMRGLQIIGEAARRVPETIQATYAEVPWSLMIGMRNRITHDYLGIDYAIVWRTIHEDFPSVLPDLRRALHELSPCSVTVGEPGTEQMETVKGLKGTDDERAMREVVF